MDGWLKQSTAVTLKIGPFVDSTDGDTEEGGLTISQADVRLSKNGGNFAQKNNATSCTHDELGIYDCPISTTDTNTLGRLELAVHESGALLVRHTYMVVPANVWDSLFGADRLQVDVREKGDANLALTTQEKADVNAEADTALLDYDAPTKAEMDARTLVAASYATSAVCTEARLAELDAANLPADLDAVLADTGTDGVVLSAATMNAVADALLDRADGVEPAASGTERTVREALRIILSAVAGKLSGAATTTVAIRDTNDSKDRISATVDADGNRSTVTLDDT